MTTRQLWGLRWRRARSQFQRFGFVRLSNIPDYAEMDTRAALCLGCEAVK